MEWYREEVYHASSFGFTFQIFSYTEEGVTYWGLWVGGPGDGEEIYIKEGLRSTELAMQEAETWLKARMEHKQ